MKKTVTVLSFLFIPALLHAQFYFEPSNEYPFGRLNPAAPEEVADFDPLIGISECASERRNNDGTWNESATLIWKWKYVMNGMGVQDETLQEGRFSAGSIRQFNPDSSAWYVHYYSSNAPVPVLPSWKGGKTDETTITLYREQTAPNGMDGFYKISFLNMTESSFDWLGEWVSPDESFIYPTWKISCRKVE